MKVGGKRTLRIPPNLAYGDQWFKGTIPPKSHLEFDLELIKVAQNPGEELLMQLQAFGVGRALGLYHSLRRGTHVGLKLANKAMPGEARFTREK